MHKEHKYFTEMHIGPLGRQLSSGCSSTLVFPSPILFSAQLLSADDASETLTKTSLTFSDSFATANIL